MKKLYTKPQLQKRSVLSAVTALVDSVPMCI